jgi:serine/threonine protein kinase
VRGSQTERREIGGLVGTIGFIDPECLARGVNADALSDLYSLGATLFQLIAGHVPALSGGVLRGDVLGGRRRAPSLAELVPSAPRELAALVDMLLSPIRDERPRSADWVATRLQQILSGLSGQPSELRRRTPAFVSPIAHRGPFTFQSPHADGA